MDDLKILEERLRECSSIGDQDGIEECLSQGAGINSQNQMNGWTALHWASKRGHITIVRLLMSRGADPMAKTNKGELAAHMTDNPEIHEMLGGQPEALDTDEKPLPITPNYLQNPPFPYGRSRKEGSGGRVLTNGPSWQSGSASGTGEVVLKVRVAESAERDYIEVELPKNALTFENLMELCCEELNVNPSKVTKIRKLPNTIVRKDKDVQRLHDFQELELVTRKNPPFGTQPYTVPIQNLYY